MELEDMTKEEIIKELRKLIGTKPTEISCIRQEQLLRELRDFKDIPELKKLAERMEYILKNELNIYI